MGNIRPEISTASPPCRCATFRHTARCRRPKGPGFRCILLLVCYSGRFSGSGGRSGGRAEKAAGGPSPGRWRKTSPEGRASSRREFCRAGGVPGAGGRRPPEGRGAWPPPGRRAAGDEGGEERAPEGPSSGCKQSLARTRGHISACSRPRVSLYILVYPYIKVLAEIVFTLFTIVRITLIVNRLLCNKTRKQMCFKRRLCLQPHAPLV